MFRTLLLLAVLAGVSTGQGLPDTLPSEQLVPVPRVVRASVRIIPPKQRQAFSEVSSSGVPATISSAAGEVVKVRAGRGQIGYGSGVHIGGGYIVSCYHTVRGTPVGSCAVQWPGGSWIPAEVIAKDARHDLTIKRVNISAVPVGRLGAGVAARMPRRGESLFLVGYPGAGSLRYWEGKPNGNVFQSGNFGIDKWVIPGYSGGPAFTSAGEVIGINVASDYPDTQSETISVSPVHINNILKPYGSAIVSARARLKEIQCGGGFCQPQGSGYPSGGGFSGQPNGGLGQPITPGIPQSVPVPQSPPSIPTPSNPSGPFAGQMLVTPVDLEKLKAEIIASIGQPLNGRDGLDGSPGPPGPAYQLTDSDRQQIAQIASTLVSIPDLQIDPTQLEDIARRVVDTELAARPVRLQIIDGEETYEQSKPLGEPIKIAVTGLIRVQDQ